jgi:tripartite-type tricarboxylate transporter receptor subunit TctC
MHAGRVIGLKRLVRVLGGLTMASMLAGASGAALAQSYPARPIRLIIPYPPGGAGDIVGRLLANKLGENLGQPIIIDNRGGGAQVIATELAAKAVPDGYTLFLASATHAINPGGKKKLPYDTVKDFAPIAMVASSPLLFVANPSVGISNMKELVALAKAQPGKLNYGSSGPGTGGHLSVELLQVMTGISMTHIPFKGAGPALIDLIGGQVQIVSTSPLAALPFVKAGKLKALGMTGRSRFPTAPDIPTVAESGFPGYEASLWYGLLAPAGTPAAIISRLHADTVKAIKSSLVSEQLLTNGAEPSGTSPQELQSFIVADIKRWTEVIKSSGIQIE